MAGEGGNKSNKNRKYDRNRRSPQNSAYKAESRREKNKARRMLRTLKDQPDNKHLEAMIRHWMDTDPAYRREINRLTGGTGV